MKNSILDATIIAGCMAVCFEAAGGGLCERDRLRPALEELHELDQGSRTGAGPANDIGNQHRLREIVENCGWPSLDTVGRKAAMGAFLVLQHAPVDMQLEYLPVLTQAQEDGHLIPGTLPYLQDRVLVRQGRPQVFGTQFSEHCQLYEISDPEKVHQLRQAAGLIPLEEYIEYCQEQRNHQ